MKKIMLLLVFLVGISMIPITAYAYGNYDDPHWRARHERMYHQHDRDWRDHDREWREHRGDRRWRREHIRMWRDWYDWHRDHEGYLGLHIHTGSDDGTSLDIDYNN